MTRCIYCERTLVPGANDGSQPSLEHIIQYAAGGSDQFATRDVCNKCNSNLGDSVDANFIHCMPIALSRLQHDIEGHGGTVSDYAVPGRSVELDVPGTIHFKRGAKVEIHHDPKVKKEMQADGVQRVEIAGTREMATQILTGMLAKAKKNGKTLFTETGQKATSAEDLLAGAVSQTSSTYQAQMALNLPDMARGFAKIAFGFNHLLFGPAWTFSPDAIALRRVAVGAADDAETMALLGGAKVEARGLYVDDDEGSADHLIAFLNGVEPPRVFISLFGGSGLTFSIQCDLGKREFADLFVGPGVAVVVNPKTRATRWVGLMELAQRIKSRQGAWR